MTNAIVTANGSHPPLPTVLGNGTVRIPTAGKIRAGIKVLTKKAADNPIAKDIYERGVAQNQSFDEIEHSITQAVPDLKTPLVPKNVAWFTVRPGDFPNPEIARQILDNFGEDRGDGVRRLYRFPVIFPADHWQAVMPHELVVWGAHEKKFWSEYAPDGQARYCKCYAPVPMDQSGKRAVRQFGGRKTMLRQENGGICNPESCPEFQTRKCNLSGRFIFFIPGVKSIDAFELHTNSFYAMSRAIEQFKTLAFLRGGRISGFLDGKQTPFYLTKTLREVPHLDDEGRAVRSAHWIIELEAPIDITALWRAQDDETAFVNARAAAHVLEGAAIDRNAAEERSDPLDRPADDAVEASQSGSGAETPAPMPQSRPTWAAAGKLAADATYGRATPSSGANDISEEQVIAAAGEFGIDAARYAAYAAKRWGPGWKLNANGRRRALDEIERYRNDPEGLADKIDTELHAFHTGA